MKKENQYTGLEIAVIGMACRFPGASDIDEFHRNLEKGTESITFFNQQELEDAGVPKELRENPAYVPAFGAMKDKESFDASFFGYTPAEAQLMDPQFRIFHEIAWETMEHAGYVSDTYKGLIGLYMGASPNFYWEAQTMFSGQGEALGAFDAAMLNNKDFLATRLSYKLNLKGTSIAFNTACSTSLVAVHLACRALLTGECTMALAGGVAVTMPNDYGYLYQEGMIKSPDGHCRAFDAQSKGTVFGEGAGAVLLKRLPAALADRDTIHAVIKVSAANNDGLRKVGYTAPSLEGQSEVIRTAWKLGKVAPETISYIEAHGTGTQMGDTIEAQALKKALGSVEKGQVAVGSVKTNVGHLDAAAGVAGLIKTVMALKARRIPPSLHFNSMNPHIEETDCPFYINGTLKQWEGNNLPLRAGVNSFGVGGTNAHVVLEETPKELEGQRPAREEHLFLLSARSSEALEKKAANLADYLKENPSLHPADVAYTLHVGRKAFKYRRILVCKDTADAVERLTAEKKSGKYMSAAMDGTNSVPVFMFSGLGAQYENMGRRLYQKEPLFRTAMDRCFDIIKTQTNEDIKAILYPPKENNGASALERVDIAQLINFSFQYALASMLMEWGIRPRAVIGYSFGEYAAACIAGVFSLEDALKLVITRSRLMGGLPRGIMLSVPVPVEEMEPLLTDFPGLSLSIDNGASCVVGGAEQDVRDFEVFLKGKRLITMRISTSHAVHSFMMEPILSQLESVAASITLNEPVLPFISNVFGGEVKAEVTVPGYWARHLRETVRFNAGIEALSGESRNVSSLFIEIGPGRDLCALSARSADGTTQRRVLNLIPASNEPIDDYYYFLNKIGTLWMKGISPDTTAFYKDQQRYRVPLPSYPFERISFKTEGNLEDMLHAAGSGSDQLMKKPDAADWFYLPYWKPAPINTGLEKDKTQKDFILIFRDGYGLGEELSQLLTADGNTVLSVEAGDSFQRGENGNYTVNPGKCSDYAGLFSDLKAKGTIPTHIIHMWNLTAAQDGAVHLEKGLETGFYALLHTVQAIRKQGGGFPESLRFTIVTAGMQDVGGEGVSNPGAAALLGPLHVIPQEHSFIRCRSIDIPLMGFQGAPPIGPPEGPPEAHIYMQALARLIMAELADDEPLIAYRGGRRWVRALEPHRLEKNDDTILPLRSKGVYLVTGGLGGMGLALAQYLAQHWKARLVLVGRTPLPPKEQWRQHIDANGPATGKIKKIHQMEKDGGEVTTFAADVSDKESLAQVVREAEKVFGPINGIIHTAGIQAGPSFQMIADLDLKHCEDQFQPKIHGLLALDDIFKIKNLDFCIAASSIASILGGLSFSAYAAANLLMDAYAESPLTNLPWTMVNWDTWIFDEEKLKQGIEPGELCMAPQEGVDAFLRVLAGPDVPRVIHSLGDLDIRVQRWIKLEALQDEDDTPEESQTKRLPRPDLMTAYVQPRNENEKKLAEIWQHLFGFQEVGVQDNFFELGGDSLKALTVAARIHKRLQVEISVPDFFENPTIEALTALMETFKTSEYTSITPARQKDFYTASSTQQRLYVIQQMGKESTGYNESIVYIMEGELDKDRVENAFRDLIARHESFRTSFLVKEQQVMQKIHSQRDVEFNLEFIDHIPPGQTEEDFIRGLSRAFNMEKPPLFRSTLIKRRENSFVLYVEMHHIISDGLSYQIFMQEFMTLYSGNTLPPLTFQYKDFSEWQNSPRQQEAIKQQESYWFDRFSDEVPQLNLPFDFPRPEIKRFEGDSVNFALSVERSAALREMVKQHEVTLFILLMALFNVLMFKLSRQEDIVVGTPVFGRRQEEFQRIIGMFVNTLALRSFPSGEKTFAAFLEEVKRHVLDAFSNQDYPFEQLADSRGGTRDASRNPLFDVLFTLQNVDTGTVAEVGRAVENPVKHTTDLTLESYPHEYQQAQFDILIFAHEEVDVVAFKMVYGTKLFKKETIQRFVEYFKEIIDAVTANRSVLLEEIKISHRLEAATLDIPDTGFDF
ncbi:MAG: SDR family NAD(P)-dependent oxidoreductase [bacterium]|nr:SDR family NAD(P)-dependent oxidoreductase [bacterium]